MDTYTGADLFVDGLERYGVEHVFGNPGTTELPLVDALSESPLEYVLGVHEDIAVGMAAGYARARRQHGTCPVGVVSLHITPGLAHGLGNLYGASMAGLPLVVTAGTHSRGFRHEEPILSGELTDLADQFCKWSTEVPDVDALPPMVRRAFRVALTPPTGPVFLGLPLDVMRAEASSEAIEPLGPIPTAGRADPTQLERAADLLVAADEPVLVVGDHVGRSGEDASEAAVALAEAIGARVHGEIMTAEIAVPTDHDQWASVLPPDEDATAAMLETDTLVFAGVSTNTTITAHERPLVDPQTTCIHLHDTAWEIGKNHRADAALLGDLPQVMRSLADRASSRLSNDEHSSRLETARTSAESVRNRLERAALDEAPPGEDRVGKHELVDAIDAVASEAFLVDEGVTAKFPLLARCSLSPGQLHSNKGGGLGYGLPAAVGAALAESMRAEPRDVLGFVGDGSYLYYPQAIYTAVRNDLDLTVVVVDNRNYRILQDNMQEFVVETDREFPELTFDPPIDLVGNAESHGARGHLIESSAELEETLESALERSGTDVVDVLVYD